MLKKNYKYFEPHRYSRAISKKEFSKSFIKSDLVIVCPLYAAGERKDLKFDLIKFSN